MKAKRTTISILLMLNIIMGVGLMTRHSSSPAAYAQSGAIPGSWVAVAARVSGQPYKALWMLDSRNRRLHVFAAKNQTSREVVFLGSRDLTEDFK